MTPGLLDTMFWTFSYGSMRLTRSFARAAGASVVSQYGLVLRGALAHETFSGVPPSRQKEELPKLETRPVELS